jgi:opacity protein-like surface antigen
MKVVRYAAYLLLLFAAPMVRAQARPTATGSGPHVDVGAMGSYYHVNYGDRNVGGIALYADTNVTWRLGLEAQAQSLRFGEEFGKRTDTYLAGPKWLWERGRMRPYAKALVGYGRFRAPYGYGDATSFVVAPGGGLDYKLTEQVTVRVVDVQYQMWPNFPLGSTHPYGVNAGISITVWRPKWRPQGLKK